MSSEKRTSSRWFLTTPGGPALITGAIGTLLYLIRITPGTGWYDAPEFVGVASTFGIAHPTGYPLYSLVGRLFSSLLGWIAEPALIVNALSALAAGATLAVMTLVTWQLIRLLRLGPLPRTFRILSSVIPAAILGSMTLFMEQAVVAEVYTLHTFMVGLLLLLGFHLVLDAEKPLPILEAGELRSMGVAVWGAAGWKRPLLIAFLAGVGLGNHFTLVLYFPALLMLFWWALRPESDTPPVFETESMNRQVVRLLVPISLLFLLGVSIYLIIPLRASLNPPFNWGEADTLRRFLRLVTAAEVRARPSQFMPITAWSIWFDIARGMSLPIFALSIAGWILAAIRRTRLGLLALLYLLFPLLFLLAGLDILEDALLPVHLWVALGTGMTAVLVGERLIAIFGPRPGTRFAFAGIALLLAVGPVLQIARNWHEVSASGAGGPAVYADAVAASVYGGPAPSEPVEGVVFSEENSTAFLLWHRRRLEQKDPGLSCVYLLLVREAWYREELLRMIPSLNIPILDRGYERLPHEAASRELIALNTDSTEPLYLSPIILPPEHVYGILVPQGVLLRMEPPGYVPDLEDVQRHVSIISEYSPAFSSGQLPRMDRMTRDWWSSRHSLMGEAWLRLGLLPAAEAEFRAGVRVNPTRLEPWMDIALFFSLVGDWKGMEATLREAIALRPRDQGLLIELARALSRQGAFDEAEKVLPTGRLKRVAGEVYLRVRAGIRLGQGEVDAALDDLEEAVGLAPESSEVWNDLGVVYLEKGQWDEAVPAFTRAVELQPDLGEAWVNLGMIAFRDANWEEAAANLDRSRQAGISNPQVGFNLGSARVNLSDFTGAEEAFRTNLRDWPLHADSYIALAALLERDGRLQEALLILENGRMAVPDDPRFGMILRRLRIPPLL
ncbi:protein O-mannosyl-transferase family [Gemmatimonadota bacterium]